MRRTLLGVLSLVLLAALLATGTARAEHDWLIDRFHAEITLQPDASMRVVESIDVDFRTLAKRGIFRYIPVQYNYNANFYRVYDLRVLSVTDANAKPWKYEVSRDGPNQFIKIGDANTTISGKQSYRITYTVQGVLNHFNDFDELYWNVNGADWGVPTTALTATVILPGGGLTDAACFQGVTGSTDRCTATRTDDRIEYNATRPLASGEQVTIVAGVRPGAVAEPQLRLEKKPRTFLQYFDVRPGTVIPSLALLGGGLVVLVGNWWARGRDRRYTSLYRLTQNPEEETRPLFKGDQIVVEYQPPDGIRPAEVGVLQDERAHTLDVTATIVDLAVRGYLTIAEVKKTGLLARFKKGDWRLTRTRPDTGGLLPYEATIFTGLFTSGNEVLLSNLKNSFYTTLQAAQKQLYQDVTARGWFSGNPETARTTWRLIGVAVMVAGGGLTWALGRWFGEGLVGIAVIVAGALLFLTAGSMARRTAKGSEALRRTLGFREYIATAETDRQRFNERAAIFAEYLPYAIVFGLVNRWANAFRDIDTTAATAGWYTGNSGFYAGDFSRSVSSFSSSVSSAIASTPGSSGGSGFSGGSSGGGGGGGGGGSW